MKRIKGWLMKKGWMMALLLAGGLAASGLPGAAEAIPADVTIGEKLFMTQVYDILVNVPEYLGKTIQYEGMFLAVDVGADVPFYCVYRYGPGCCGDDGMIGFEVVWEGGRFNRPADDDWVRVTGVLEEYAADGAQYVRLNVHDIAVLDTRGIETVTQ